MRIQETNQIMKEAKIGRIDVPKSSTATNDSFLSRSWKGVSGYFAKRPSLLKDGMTGLGALAVLATTVFAIRKARTAKPWYAPMTGGKL